MRTDDAVWYVAYGSNLSRERFRAYLEGGRRWARDATTPVAATPRSRARAGCSASPAASASPAPRRCGAAGWRSSIPTATARWWPGPTWSASASSATWWPRSRTASPAATSSAAPTAASRALSRFYDTSSSSSPDDGVPVMTITARAASSEPPVAPAAPYLTTILAGLADGCGLDAEARVDYLLRARGVAPAWDRAGLLALDAVRR